MANMVNWLLILLVVVAGSAGDVFSAKGMAAGGEIKSFRVHGFKAVLHGIAVRKMVIVGILCDAIGFFSLLALLTRAPLSIAIPATALSFVIDTLGARFILHEEVHWKRWIGVLCVAAGVLLTMDSAVPPKKVQVQPDQGVTSGGPGTAGVSAVQPHKHQSGHHQRGSK